MKTALGAILLLAGLFFAAQGAGWIAWPQESFMVSRSPWIGYGLGIAAVGAILILIRRKRGS
jgi:hypothetical protein